ncbi:uncharacterized protein LOC106012232 [Aplysia californica]|uniref:Uncharacterized protein LOC106012232 n=1 Tax=Aplysia californica TaxID=6500 RepID=A0ABM1A3B6_APLCA|nr:uncharacterized protein LOC106012232 [Aplysia californica]
MSAILFNLDIDWVMRKTTDDTLRGIRWTLFSTLEDLADNLELLSHTNQHMHEKTNQLHKYGRQIRLKISQKKTEVMTLNEGSPTLIRVNNADLPITDKFTYLGSIIKSDGGTKEDIMNRLGKASLYTEAWSTSGSQDSSVYRPS